ncbi:hypothetical protein LWI28_026828 [Acer negundo]|uniref:Fe2OG dioxygenase domain-containing protein n=1 Tax=Acer negundo TaxID=4023 RepID=A0AAD5P1H4_ACENE|nr:hypothetical protein LWI28_026828 [Acer negundo]
MAPSMCISLNDSSDVTDFVIKQGHGVKGLSETGIKSLPEQYIQPLEERLMTKIEPQESIPVIDMAKWDDKQVANSICDAAEKWGFFQVVNHGVPLQVLDNVKKATCDFFGLPAEEKIKYSKENSSSNNVRFGTSFTPHAEKALEWKDYLSLFYVSEEEAAALWPSDNVGGLYVRGNEGQDSWIHVPPINRAIVINIGDALQIMSNGRYRSVEHRVTANGSSNRISVPIFVNPRPQDIIGPLPEALANGEKPIYKQVLYSDYVTMARTLVQSGDNPLSLKRKRELIEQAAESTIVSLNCSSSRNLRIWLGFENSPSNPVHVVEEEEDHEEAGSSNSSYPSSTSANNPFCALFLQSANLWPNSPQLKHLKHEPRVVFCDGAAGLAMVGGAIASGGAVMKCPLLPFCPKLPPLIFLRANYFSSCKALWHSSSVISVLSNTGSVSGSSNSSYPSSTSANNPFCALFLQSANLWPNSPQLKHLKHEPRVVFCDGAAGLAMVGGAIASGGAVMKCPLLPFCPKLPPLIFLRANYFSSCKALW